MITEDYVNFETAKLLKEKGFDEHCGTAYTTTEGYPIRIMGSTYSLEKNSDYDEFHYSMPSQSLALKWLRENNFHIIIDIDVDYDEDERGMKWYHKSAWYWIVYRIDDRKQMSDNGDLYSTYEEACEAALNFVLKNLI